MNTEPQIGGPLRVADQPRERAVVNSALWAAAGDALGWITELSRGANGVIHRSGTSKVSQPVAWKRLIGGRGGPRVDLPAGTYSDDTQLRLAVSRSIRGDGSFDAETFAKVEVTVWPTYALGGGLGTKAAAANLSKRSTNWFSNFFASSKQTYIGGGGNGAAMRIQPHVWSSSSSVNKLLTNVLRDALVTHGHPHGFCGAIFHALCLEHALRTNAPPSPKDWREFIDAFRGTPDIIDADAHLGAFWRTAWENNAGTSLVAAISKIWDEAHKDIQLVEQTCSAGSGDSYHRVLEALGCLAPQFRGSGFKTALAAAFLAYEYSTVGPEVALALAANELESDTDTIGTMAGAILGVMAGAPPKWAVQDREYIEQEAKRLAAISLGVPQDSFTYPDLGHWNPPAKQTASIGIVDGGLAIAGLGRLRSIGPAYSAGDATWEWYELPFGQTILAKRRSEVRTKLASSQLPGARQKATHSLEIRTPSVAHSQSSLSLDPVQGTSTNQVESAHKNMPKGTTGLDAWTDLVIQSDFDNYELGRLLNQCIERTGSVDSAVAFAAIIAKAKLARLRRRR